MYLCNTLSFIIRFDPVNLAESTEIKCLVVTIYYLISIDSDSR